MAIVIASRVTVLQLHILSCSVLSSELFLRYLSGKLARHNSTSNNYHQVILFDGPPPVSGGGIFLPRICGFHRVAGRTQSKRSGDCISAHFVGVLCPLLVERVAELRDKNGKIIRCPFARILHGRGSCRSAERQKIASVPAKKNRNKKYPCFTQMQDRANAAK